MRDVRVEYEAGDGSRVLVLDHVSLSVNDEILVLVGPNGAGKSTLIGTIAGLIPPAAGKVVIASGREARPRVALIAQAYREANFPWLSVLDNIAMFAPGFPNTRETVVRQARRLLAQYLPEVNPCRFPYETSGGQQQAIALLRALAAEASILLADEPLSAIDQGRNWHFVRAVQEDWARRPRPIVWASHNIDEAILLADRIALLSRATRTVVDVLPIESGRLRSLEWLKGSVAVDLRAAIIDFFASEGAKHAANTGPFADGDVVEC